MSIRPLVPFRDAETVTGLYQANREFLRAHESARDEDFFTFELQRARLEQRARSGVRQFLIYDGEEPAGLISLFNFLPHGPESCQVGYWVAEERQGKGLATAAVGAAVDYAFLDLALHRVEAATLLGNAASQTVLRRNGFRIFGEAKSYLLIDGRWRAVALFERVCGVSAPNEPPSD